MARKYKCPYCSYTGEREDLIGHVLDTHEEMIPEGYTARRIVYNKVNNTDHGICMICKQKTEWNETAGKYNKLCGKPACKQAVREAFKKNMIKVHNTTCLLGDPAQQEKMLANRGISKTYKFANGATKIYTGSYEGKLLEFEEKVLRINPEDIIMPGPTLQYEFEGKKHTWITDQYLVPWNLIIEVKDGGDNPNTRPMQSYRDKQVAKETMITAVGTFNYLRLTNNQFDQLLNILAEMKLEMINDKDENRKITVRINEGANAATNAMPSVNNYYAVSYGYKNVFNNEDIEGFALSKDILSDSLFVVENAKIIKKSLNFLNERKFSIYKYTGTKTIDSILTEGEVADDYLYRSIIDSGVISKDFFETTPLLIPVTLAPITDINEAIKATILHQFKEASGEDNMYFQIRNPNVEVVKKDVIGDHDNLDILRDINGYFVFNKSLNQRSSSYPTVREIPKTVADIMATKDIKEGFV